MNIVEGMQLEKETYDRIENYNKRVGKKIIILATELIKKYPYKTSKIKKVHMPEVFEFSDRTFGGNAYRCATLKDSPYVLIVDKFFNTLAIYVPYKNLSEFNVNELLKIASYLNVKHDKTIKKDQFIELLTNY